MQELKLLRALYDNETYKRNKPYLKEDFFSSQNKLLYQALIKWHDTYDRNCNAGELGVFIDHCYPVHSLALKETLRSTITRLENDTALGNDLVVDVISALYKADKAKQIGEAAAKIIAGESSSFSTIKNLLEINEEERVVEFQPVTDDVESVIAGVEQNVKWHPNITGLRERIRGIGPGVFTLVFARPETGKTGLLVSLMAGSGGFVEQGATVHYFGNEEPAIRTMGRCITAYCEHDMQWVKDNTAQAKEWFNRIRGKLKLFDCVGTSIEEVEEHVRINHPDILVLDQLDKFYIDGQFAREDMRIRQLYIKTREIAKKHNVSIIGACQASAEGDNSARMNFTWCENSKTGKAAECDLIIGIGINDAMDPLTRMLTLCKNKITGNHDNFCVVIEPEKSIFRD